MSDSRLMAYAACSFDELESVVKASEANKVFEKLQQRIEELESKQPEWVCDTCNTCFPVSAVKRISDCVCPNNCGDTLKPRSQTERLLEGKLKELEKERDALATILEDQYAKRVEDGE